jgi:signal transduction histidine kinase
VLIATNEDGIRIDVRNEGASLDPQEIPLLFDAFFRGERVRRLPGTGIGLTLIRAIALHHHGSFSLANTGSGVLARLTLPSASAN